MHICAMLLIASSPRQLVFTCSQSFVQRTSAICIISVGGKGKRIGWKQINENAFLHHSPSVSYISCYLALSSKITSVFTPKNTYFSRYGLFFLCWMNELNANYCNFALYPIRTALPLSTSGLFKLQTVLSTRAGPHLSPACEFICPQSLYPRLWEEELNPRSLHHASSEKQRGNPGWQC